MSTWPEMTTLAGLPVEPEVYCPPSIERLSALTPSPEPLGRPKRGPLGFVVMYAEPVASNDPMVAELTVERTTDPVTLVPFARALTTSSRVSEPTML